MAHSLQLQTLSDLHNDSITKKVTKILGISEFGPLPTKHKHAHTTHTIYSFTQIHVCVYC